MSCNKPDTIKSRDLNLKQKMWVDRGPGNHLEEAGTVWKALSHCCGGFGLLGLCHTKFIKLYGSFTLKMVVFSLV